MPKLHKVLKASYEGGGIGDGFVRDDALSNDDYQTYYNPESKKLIFSVSGTHNLRDVGTDLWLAFGGLKKTNRYKEADKALKQAKQKYGGAATSVVGHSLGGSIAQNIASKGDDIKTLDAGYTFGQRTRGEHYRTSGDVVSALGAGAKHTTTLADPHPKTGIFSLDSLRAHNVDNIANHDIFV